jgi:hypothetical protein
MPRGAGRHASAKQPVGMTALAANTGEVRAFVWEDYDSYDVCTFSLQLQTKGG